MGSANDKIIYLNSTKELIKNKINDLGGELDSQDPFREYSNSLDIIYEEYPKINDTNENITLQNTNAGKMEIELKSTELTQDGTPTPDNPVDVNVITGSNNVKVENKNIFNSIVLSQEENYNNFNNNTGLWTTSSNGGYYRSIFYNVTGSQNQRDINKLILLKANTNYTIKFYDFSYAGSGDNYLSYGLFDNLGVYINQINGKEFVNITTPNENCYLDIRRISNNRNFIFSKIMIIEGTYTVETVPNYIEHQEQNYPITLSSKNLFNINGDVNTRYNGQTGNYNTVIDNDLTSTYSNNNGYIYGQRIYVGVGKTVTVSAKVKSFVPNNKVGTVGRITAFNDNTTYGASYVTYNNDETEIKTLTFTPTTDYIYVAFGFVAPTSQQSSVTFTDIQVEYGETATTYMPYIANPIEYCKIGDYADELIIADGKNLFNVEGNINTRYNGSTENYNSTVNNKLITTYSTNNGYPYGQRIYVGAGNKITISAVVSNIEATGSKGAVIMCFNDNTTNNYQSTTFTDNEINIKKHFTFIPETDYIIIAFAGKYSGFITATFTDIQVEYGDNTTDYEPYGENEWYLKKNIGKVTFDGSEFTLVSNYNNLNYASVLKPMDFIGRGDYMLYKIVCSKAISQSVELIGWDSANMIGKLTTEPSKYNMWIGVPKTVTLEEIQETLNSTITYYPLATPTYIHISETDYPILRSQLENLYNNAQSYNGETNIIQINDDLSFIIKAIALMGGDE